MFGRRELRALRVPPMLLLVSLLTISGCDAIGDIFQAGLLVGIIAVVIVIAIIVWLAGKFRGRSQG